MRRLLPYLLLCVFLIFPIIVGGQGQNFPGSGSGITYVTSNPVTFVSGNVFYNTTTNQFLCATSSTVLVVCSGPANSAPTAANSILQLGITGPLFIGFPTEGSGTVWHDLSGQGNNLTFGSGCNNPTWVPVIGLTFVSASSQCINMPATINPAQTLIAVASYTSVGGNFQSPIMGNGNGGATGADGLIIGITAFSNTVPSGYIPSILCNSGNADLSTALLPVGSPVFTAGVINSGGNDRIYYNDINPIIPTGQTNCAAQTIGHYVVGGQAAGIGFGLRTYLDGTIYAIAAFSGQATSNQIKAAYYIIRDYLQKNGVVMNGQTTTSGNTIILVGDSQTQSPGGLYVYFGNVNAALTTPLVSLISMPAISGNTALAELSTTPYIAQPMVPVYNGSQSVAGNGGVCLIHNWLGTVDIVSRGETAAQTWGNLSSVLRNEANTGCKLIASTVVSSTGFDATIQTLDTTIRNNAFASGVSYLSDLASVQILGASGASTGACFTDGIHQTAGCSQNITSALVYEAVASLLGPHDFSAAAVYAAPATAAVATTALSETGNTMTITMAATPANCQVGDWAVVAGTTPAGYSNSNLAGVSPFGWWINARNATTITAYNDTSGLGAQTGAGTVVCSQMQQADNYVVLNFGAGNFTMVPCEGWTGQTRWFKNINAVGSTIVPFGTETIDGAANISIASGATVGLQSRLTSLAAAGCNLFRVQNN